MNAFLIMQGIETLSLRMDRHCENTQKVAEYLKAHPRVGWVSYAGLPDHPDHAQAMKYLGGRASGILSFGVKGGYDAGVKFLDALRLVDAPGEHRRCQIARHASGLDHPPAAESTGTGRSRRAAGHGAPVDRHRERRRHPGGCRSGARRQRLTAGVGGFEVGAVACRAEPRHEVVHGVDERDV